MKENTKPVKSSLWKTSIRTPLVLTVLMVTCGLTILFYYSQSHNSEMYFRYIDTLSEYKYLDAKLETSLERARFNIDEDSAAIEGELMTLREIVVSLSMSMEKFRTLGDWMPEINRSNLLEREVLNKVAISRRYIKERRSWLRDLRMFASTASGTLESSSMEKMLYALDTLRLGYMTPTLDSLKLTEPLAQSLDSLVNRHRELARIWERLERSQAALWAEDLILDFKMREQKEIERRSELSIVFYLFSISMLLCVLFLYVRKSPAPKSGKREIINSETENDVGTSE